MGKGTKPGDWYCPSCNDLQFAKNPACRKCGAPNPDPWSSMQAMNVGLAMGYGGAQEKPGDWYCPSCGDLQFQKNTTCRQCGTPNPAGGCMMMMGSGGGRGGSRGKPSNAKPGDWMCPACGDHQFAMNATCRKCGAAKPESGHKNVIGMKAGDWNCPACGDLQFAKNEVCRKCGTPNPDVEGSLAAMEAGIEAGTGGAIMREGDWYCPGCGDLQFARNAVCRKCQTPNPDPDAAAIAKSTVVEAMKPGDWNCPACGDHQFARNMTCRKCGTANPAGGMMGMKGGGMKGGGGMGGGKGCGMMNMMQQMWGGGMGCMGKGCMGGGMSGGMAKGCAGAAAKPCAAKGSVGKGAGKTPQGIASVGGKGAIGKSAAKPAAAAGGAVSEGTSWNCPSCQKLVFRRYTECPTCGMSKPGTIVIKATPKATGGKNRASPFGWGGW